MILLVVVVGTMLALLTVAGVVWVRTRLPREEVYHYVRCSGCGQKVRYPASKAGRLAICPRCKQPWSLPTTPPVLATDTTVGETKRVLVGKIVRVRAPAA